MWRLPYARAILGETFGTIRLQNTNLKFDLEVRATTGQFRLQGIAAHKKVDATRLDELNSCVLETKVCEAYIDAFLPHAASARSAEAHHGPDADVEPALARTPNGVSSITKLHCSSAFE